MIIHPVSLIARTALLSLCGLLVAVTAQAHPRHTSIAEAEWNTKSGRLEIALQVHPVDLEQALRRISSRPVDLDKSNGLDRLMQDYLARTFVVKPVGGKPVQLKWVGYEVDLKDAWLYFEVPMKEGPLKATFGAGYFFELLPDQANTINFRIGKLRKSLTFTVDQLEAVLE